MAKLNQSFEISGWVVRPESPFLFCFLMDFSCVFFEPASAGCEDMDKIRTLLAFTRPVWGFLMQVEQRSIVGI